MKKSKEKKKKIGKGIGEAIRKTSYFLTILFTVLRACQIIKWSWFWIMSPIFISWMAALATVVFLGLVATVAWSEEEDGAE